MAPRLNGFLNKFRNAKAAAADTKAAAADTKAASADVVQMEEIELDEGQEVKFDDGDLASIRMRRERANRISQEKELLDYFSANSGIFQILLNHCKPATELFSIFFRIPQGVLQELKSNSSNSQKIFFAHLIMGLQNGELAGDFIKKIRTEFNSTDPDRVINLNKLIENMQAVCSELGKIPVRNHLTCIEVLGAHLDEEKKAEKSDARKVIVPDGFEGLIESFAKSIEAPGASISAFSFEELADIMIYSNKDFHKILMQRCVPYGDIMIACNPVVIFMDPEYGINYYNESYDNFIGLSTVLCKSVADKKIDEEWLSKYKALPGKEEFLEEAKTRFRNVIGGMSKIRKDSFKFICNLHKEWDKKGNENLKNLFNDAGTKPIEEARILDDLRKKCCKDAEVTRRDEDGQDITRM